MLCEHKKMFKVRKFEYDMTERQYRSFSPWSYCPSIRWEKLWNLIDGCTFCRYEFFPYIFWLMLFLSLKGAYRSLGECVSIYTCSSHPIKMWRPRKFFVISVDVLRKGRLVGAIVTSFAWIMMIYALLNAQPIFLAPWLILNTFVLVLEFALWLAEVLTGRMALQLNDVYPMLRLCCSLALVNWVRTVFQAAIAHNMISALSLLDPNTIFCWLFANAKYAAAPFFGNSS